MIRHASLALVLFACTAGDPATNNTIGRTCSAALSITGTFAQTTPPPTEPNGSAFTGCWPIGTWTFSATVGTSDCTDSPMLAASYSFRGTEGSDENGDPTEDFAYSDPSAHTIVKVTAAGNGACEGELDLFSPDGLKEWDFAPWLMGTAISGEGAYNEYTTDQWVGSGSGA
jgi:hypothetical protein